MQAPHYPIETGLRETSDRNRLIRRFIETTARPPLESTAGFPFSGTKELHMHRLAMAASRLFAAGCLILTTFGCGDENPNDPYSNLPPQIPGGGSSGPGGPGGPRSNPKLKELMGKIGRGPQALQGSLGAALKQSEPAWDTIQSKAHEYALATGELGKHEPVKGAKDSWAKLTATFSEAAADLDKEAQAKDKEKTVAALDNLGNSCKDCHQQHRIMGPPGGGPRGGPPGGMGGGPPGGFRPPPGYPGVGGGGGSPPPPAAKPAGEDKAK
jgi:hypothetical protein